MSIRLVLFAIFSLWVTKKSFSGKPIYLALLLISIYFVYPEKYIWGLIDYRVVLVLNVILAVCILVHNRKISLFCDIYSRLTFGLFFSVLVSSLVTVGNPSIAQAYALLFLKVIIFWFLLKACIQNKEELNLFYWTCLLSVTFLSLWGIQQYTVGNIRLEGFGGSQIVGSNQMAAAMVWAIPIAFFKFEQGVGWSRKIALACLCLLLGGIVCTQSRQAVVALLFCAPWYFLYAKRKSFLIMICLLGALIGSFIVPQEFFERVETIQGYEEDASASGRIEQWKGAYQMFLDNPVFGVGGKNYYVLAHQYVDNPRVTHNTYFQILSEEGAVGIIIFVSMMGLAIFRLGKIARWRNKADRPAWISHYAMIAQMNLLGLMVICVFQNKAEHEFLYWPLLVAVLLEREVRQWDKNQTTQKTIVD